MAITKTQLEQYVAVVREIDLLDEHIRAAEAAGEYAVDQVRGSRDTSPYDVRSITIKGYVTNYVPRLLKRKERLIKKSVAVEQFVDSVEDSNLRQMFELRYIRGLKVSEVAARIGYSERQTRRRMAAYFEKMSDNVR